MRLGEHGGRGLCRQHNHQEFRYRSTSRSRCGRGPCRGRRAAERHSACANPTLALGASADVLGDRVPRSGCRGGPLWLGRCGNGDGRRGGTDGIGSGRLAACLWRPHAQYDACLHRHHRALLGLQCAYQPECRPLAMAIKKEFLDELLAAAEGKDVFGKDGLFDDLKKAFGGTDAERRDGPPSWAGSGG